MPWRLDVYFSSVFRPMAGKFPKTRNFRYWEIQVKQRLESFRIFFQPELWIYHMVDGQTNNTPEEGMRCIYCSRSLVVTIILRAGRSISSQSSSNFQKHKTTISQHALEFHNCFKVFEKRKHLIQDVKTVLSVKPVIHEMPGCFVIPCYFLERCEAHLNFDER